MRVGSYIDVPDPLTGLLSRDMLNDRLNDKDAPLQPTVAMFLDVDHFNEINTTASHVIGDHALREIGTAVKRLVERYEGARAYRYGGDELVVIMDGYSRNEGLALAERIRINCAELRISDSSVRMTVSIGLAAGDSASLKAVLSDADRALMMAKKNGRNRVAAFGGGGSAEKLTKRGDISTIEGNRDKSSSAPTLTRGETLPPKVQRIYRETLAANASELAVLAAIGVRALVESVCSDCAASGSTLQKKIDDLVAKGVLAQGGAQILHQTRFLGNRAAHEIEAPTDDELAAALEVAQYLLNTVYVLPSLAARLPLR